MQSYVELILEMLGGETPRQKHSYLLLLNEYAKLGKLVFEKSTNIEFIEDDVNLTQLNAHLHCNKLFAELEKRSDFYDILNDLMPKFTNENLEG